MEFCFVFMNNLLIMYVNRENSDENNLKSLTKIKKKAKYSSKFQLETNFMRKNALKGLKNKNCVLTARRSHFIQHKTIEFLGRKP